jgi:hypothetical protein
MHHPQKDSSVKSSRWHNAQNIEAVNMEICLRGRRTLDYKYIVEGLTRSLLSRRVLKDLDLISQDFHNVIVNTVEKTTLTVTEHCQVLD